MARTRSFTVSLTSNGSQVGTAYTPYLTGYVESIQYVKDGTTPYTNGVDFTITAEATTQTIWTESNVNAAKVCLPRGATHSNAGVAAVYASGGTAVNDMFRIGNDRIKIVIASGGSTHTGAFHIVAED